MTDTPAPKDAPRDFFISYATPDGAWAEWVAWIFDSATFSAALATLQNHDVVRLNDGNAQIIVEVFRRWVSGHVID